MNGIKPIEESGPPYEYSPGPRDSPQKLQLDVTISIQQDQQPMVIPQQTPRLQPEKLVERLNAERTLFFLSRGMMDT